jgi:hypothetical protein
VQRRNRGHPPSVAGAILALRRLDLQIRDLGIDFYQLVDSDGTIRKWSIYTLAELVELHTAIGRMIVGNDDAYKSACDASRASNWTTEEILAREG